MAQGSPDPGESDNISPQALAPEFRLKALLSFLFAACALANPASGGEVFATVDALHGEAHVIDAAGATTALTVGSTVYEGQTVVTRAQSELHLATADEGFLALRPNTTLKVDAYRAGKGDDDRMHLSLVSGALRSITGWLAKFRRDAYRLRTPTATIGIRGTDHEVLELDTASGSHEAGVYNRVYEGATVILSDHGEIEVEAGRVGFLPRDRRAAGRLLQEIPDLFQDRPLKIEQRIAQRKEALADAMERVREKRARARDAAGDDDNARDGRPRVNHRMIRKFKHRND